MTMAATRFFDFLHENKNNPRIVARYSAFIKLATAIYQAEQCGFVIDPDSVTDACRMALEG